MPYPTAAEARAAYDFTDLHDFLNLYYRGMTVLRIEDDFADLTDAYLARAREQGVRHAEIFFDPQNHLLRGVPLADIVDGIGRALDEAERRHGLSSRLIMCFLRDQSPQSALDVLEQARPFYERLAGVGLDSAEAGHPPREFEEVFARAREAGLLTFADAGEEGPPTTSVRRSTCCASPASTTASTPPTTSLLVEHLAGSAYPSRCARCPIAPWASPPISASTLDGSSTPGP